MNTPQTFLITPCGARSFQVVARGLAASVLFLLSVGLLGCQPKLDPKEYGEVITVLPYVPGIEKPYRLPELEESADEAKDAAPPNAK